MFYWAFLNNVNCLKRIIRGLNAVCDFGGFPQIDFWWLRYPLCSIVVEYYTNGFRCVFCIFSCRNKILNEFSVEIRKILLFSKCENINKKVAKVNYQSENLNEIWLFFKSQPGKVANMEVLATHLVLNIIRTYICFITD